ncbi:hypothetical protein KO527_05025 [Pseudoalteromonas sp. C2R02]|uniref:hypothetical protein n=1 Tax=Pseudoalteromonas sp. C2R02 TaxID=2841565 RepID=UPI001C07F8C4|nr:hypothetical protein [Pseudoalteromonas sp. C2R02]MBU2968709.1 hypothetical protein [Pseudoalteromonas sp. C2R02]
MKPEIKDLQIAINEALADDESLTPELLVKQYLDNLVTLLKKEPIRYRLFGAWWWPIKKLLIDLDYQLTDENIDLPLFSKLNYDLDIHTITAAWAYSTEMLTEHGLLIGNDHQPITDSNDQGAYVIDEFMESLITQ